MRTVRRSQRSRFFVQQELRTLLIMSKIENAQVSTGPDFVKPTLAQVSEVKAVIRQELTAAGHCVPYAEPERQVLVRPLFRCFPAHISVCCQIGLMPDCSLFWKLIVGAGFRPRQNEHESDARQSSCMAVRPAAFTGVGVLAAGGTQAAHAPGNACSRSAMHSLKQPCLEVASWVSQPPAKKTPDRTGDDPIVGPRDDASFSYQILNQFCPKVSHDGAGHQPQRRRVRGGPSSFSLF